MKQNITKEQIYKGIKKMLLWEYEYNDAVINVVVNFITERTYLLNYSRFELETYFVYQIDNDFVMKLENDDVNGIQSFYSNFTNGNIFVIFKAFKNDLFKIIEHFVWAQWLYL